MRWHYSKRLPVFKSVRVGVWDDGKFAGVVMFGQGATPEFGKKYGLQRTQICELTRVALGKHSSPTSKIVAIAVKMVSKRCPKLRLIISFADSEQGHTGTIYQAGNWLYAGQSVTHGYRVNGKIEHPKTLHSRYGKGGQSVPWLRSNVDENAERVVAAVKHRYLMPLDAEMRTQIESLRQPYPKKASGSELHRPLGHG